MALIISYGKTIELFFKENRIISAIVSLLVLTALPAGCVDKKNKQKLFVKTHICNQLWREKFRIFSGGAYSAELYTDYLTDSTNFRIYIGSHDLNASFNYHCKGDSVIVRKYSHNENKPKKILEESIFSLSKLRKEHKFE